MPVLLLKVDAETPLSLHGDTADRPSPAPHAIRRRASAAAPTAPAARNPHDVADCASTIVDAARKSVSIQVSRTVQIFRLIIQHARESSARQRSALSRPPPNHF